VNLVALRSVGAASLVRCCARPQVGAPNAGFGLGLGVRSYAHLLWIAIGTEVVVRSGGGQGRLSGANGEPDPTGETLGLQARSLRFDSGVMVFLTSANNAQTIGDSLVRWSNCEGHQRSAALDRVYPLCAILSRERVGGLLECASGSLGASLAILRQAFGPRNARKGRKTRKRQGSFRSFRAVSRPLWSQTQNAPHLRGRGRFSSGEWG
jgi:hypothetical protein